MVYTLAAILNEGLTVVVEPLKLIMEKQVEKLRQKHTPAFYYNSSLTNTEMEFVINTLCRQELQYVMLFTSPECIVSKKLLNVLNKWKDAGRLNFIAIDEAHCIDVWGVAFRPDYLKLGMLKELNVPIIALTGTGSRRVHNKIVDTLNMNSHELIHVSSSRHNLHIQILPKKDKPNKQIAEFINENCQGHCGHELKCNNINAIFVEHAWTSGCAHVICATKSFGMGVDQKKCSFCC